MRSNSSSYLRACRRGRRLALALFIALGALAPPKADAQMVSDSVKMTLSVFQYVHIKDGRINCGSGVVATWPNIREGATYGSYSKVATEGMYVPAGWGETGTDPDKGITVPDGHFGHIAHYGWSDGPESSGTAGCAEGVAGRQALLGGGWTVLNARPYRITDWYAVISIPNGTPIALFEWKETSALTATFDASFASRMSHEVDASAALKRVPVASYAWDFGDGSTGGGDRPAHTYDSAGTYRVKLTVTDDDGQTDSMVTAVTVTDAALAIDIAPPARAFKGDTIEVVATVRNTGLRAVRDVIVRRDIVFASRIDPELNLEGSRTNPPVVTPLALPAGESGPITRDELAPGASIEVRRRFFYKTEAGYRAPGASSYVSVESIGQWDLPLVGAKNAAGEPVRVIHPCPGADCDDTTVFAVDKALQVAVAPSSTVSIRPEKQKSWKVTVTAGRDNVPVAGATVHVRNQLLEQVDEIAGVTDADGLLTYTFTAPKGKDSGEYVLNFWATKEGSPTSATTRLKVRYQTGDRIVYYECNGFPLLEFDAGQGNEFEKDEVDPDIYRRAGIVTINGLVKVDGDVTINTRNGSERITLNGRMYIPNIPLPGGERGDLVFYNGPFSYTPGCESAITSLVASMEKEVAGVTLQLEKLTFEGGLASPGVRVGGKASFSAVSSTCTGGAGPEETVSIGVEMLVTAGGVTEFKIATNNLGVGPSFCLKDLLFAYESVADKLTLGGKFIIGRDVEPWISLALKAEFLKGQFNSIEGEAEFPCVPIGATGLCFKGLQGKALGLVAPPRTFELRGVMTSRIQPDVLEFSAGGRYTDPAKFALTGGLTMFKVDAVSADNPWQAEIADAALEFDLPAFRSSVGGTLGIGHFGDKAWIFNGKASLEIEAREQATDFRGTASGSFTIPDGSEVPQLALKRAGFVLPWTLAGSDILIDDWTFTANFDFRSAADLLGPGLSEALGRWNVQVGLVPSVSLSFGTGALPLERVAGREPIDAIEGAAADRIDTITVMPGMENMFVGVIGDGAAPSTWLVSPSGERYEMTASDSSVVLSSAPGEPQVFWMVPDPSPGAWVFGVTEARPGDSAFAFATPARAPFDVTATRTGSSLAVSWTPSPHDGDDVSIWLDRDGDGYDGMLIGSFAGAEGAATLALPEYLPACEYNVYGLRFGPSGVARDYAPATIANAKTMLPAPTSIAAVRHHRWGHTRISWDPSTDGNAAGYAIYVRDGDGNDSLYATAFRDQIATTVQIEDYASKSVSIVTFDDEGRQGCPSDFVPIALSDVRAEPATGVTSSLSLVATPNPTTGRTRIGFALRNASPVRISARDLDGREVAVLADRLYEAGEYAIAWDTDGLPAGSYLVTIVAAGRTESLMTVVVR